MAASDKSQRQIVVVGAGVTGLVVAQLLAEAGLPVVVVERLEEPGGLARSFHYDGFVFDVGPHRFHTSNPHVETWLRRVLGDDLLVFPRLSEVYFAGRYYRWPLKPHELMQLPPSVAVKSALDLAVNSLRRYGDDSFQSYILRQYGPTLYAHFFRDYSEDFLGIHPRDTHSDWAKAGINRAIIDDNLEMQNLSQLLKATLLQFNKKETDFIYPKGGMFKIWENLCRDLDALGVRVILGTPARMVAEGDRVQAVMAGEERLEVGQVVWTGSIGQACEDLGLERQPLDYRALILYNVMSEGVPPRDYQWCYYGARDIVFSRVSMPHCFDVATCPPGTAGLTAEVTCMEGDERWRHAERLTDWVADDLVRVGMLPGRDAIHDIRVERIPESYPVYRMDYPEALEKAQKSLAGFSNLHMAGRTGTFWYNNMDHCIEAAMALVKRLLSEEGLPQADDAAMARGPDWRKAG